MNHLIDYRPLCSFAESLSTVLEDPGSETGWTTTRHFGLPPKLQKHNAEARTVSDVLVYDFGMTDASVNAEAVMRFYELVREATSVRVVEGSSISTKRKNDKLLFAANDAGVLAELRDALRLRPLGARIALMTPGNPTLELKGKDGFLLSIQYLGGDPDIIRSETLPQDAVLATRDALGSWLAKYESRTVMDPL